MTRQSDHWQIENLKMKKDSFLIELIKSGPFRILIIIVLMIILGVIISHRKEKAVRLKEDILYIPPNPDE